MFYKRQKSLLFQLAWHRAVGISFQDWGDRDRASERLCYRTVLWRRQTVVCTGLGDRGLRPCTERRRVKCLFRGDAIFIKIFPSSPLTFCPSEAPLWLFSLLPARIPFSVPLSYKRWLRWGMAGAWMEGYFDVKDPLRPRPLCVCVSVCVCVHPL